jgi:isoleucyl-tRNA synthetase
MKAVGAAIQKLSLESILKLEKGEMVSVEGEEIQLSDVEIRRAPKEGNANLATHQIVSIEVDPTVTPEQEREGLAREAMRKVQMARKAADFQLDDRIQLEIACSPEIIEAINAHKDLLLAETLTDKFVLHDLSKDPSGKHVEAGDIDGKQIKIGVTALARS